MNHGLSVPAERLALEKRRQEWESSKRKRLLTSRSGSLESEPAGVVRSMHYSFLVFVSDAFPSCRGWREADELLLHAHQAGERIIMLGAYPSLRIGPLLHNHTFDIATILRESLQAETSRSVFIATC